MSDSEFLWAGVDAALILTPFKGSGKAASGAKVLAEAAEREVAETSRFSRRTSGGTRCSEPWREEDVGNCWAGACVKQ